MSALRLAVLISGRGSNLQALIDACKNTSYPAEIAVVISNNPGALGLARAADADIPAMIVDHTYFKGDKAGFENALASIIEQHNADLICLAGFMRILSAQFLDRFAGRVINIHPSLLPKHKGLDTHEAAIAAGDKEHGCTVHVVTPEMDEGPVLGQRAIKIKKDDTPRSLALRVLEEEHILYPEIIKKIATGRVVITRPAIETKPSIRHHDDRQGESPLTIETEILMNHDHSATTTPVADPHAVKDALAMWSAFTKATIFAGGVVAVTLILMAAFLA